MTLFRIISAEKASFPVSLLCDTLDVNRSSFYFGEAVIVHELVHLLVPNHGRLFKATFAAYMPDCERRIREHG